MEKEEAIETCAAVRKTIGTVRFLGFELAANRAFTAIKYMWPPSELAWDQLSDEQREYFMGLVATLYTTGYEQGINDARVMPTGAPRS